MFKLVTIYDHKSETYSNPATFRTNGEAIRSFTTAVNEEGSAYHKYPEDFVLFELGEFDPATGEIAINSSPVPLIKAVDVLESVSRQEKRPQLDEVA